MDYFLSAKSVEKKDLMTVEVAVYTPFNYEMERLWPLLERLVGSLPAAFTVKFFCITGCGSGRRQRTRFRDYKKGGHYWKCGRFGRVVTIERVVTIRRVVTITRVRSCECGGKGDTLLRKASPTLQVDSKFKAIF